MNKLDIAGDGQWFDVTLYREPLEPLVFHNVTWEHAQMLGNVLLADGLWIEVTDNPQVGSLIPRQENDKQSGQRPVPPPPPPPPPPPIRLITEGSQRPPKPKPI